MSGEKGQALPLAIAALAIGALVITPFLGLAGTSLTSSRVYGEAIVEQSAADAGVEHAIWSLTWDSLADTFIQPGDQVSYQLGETINGLPVSITITANAIARPGGDITDTVIDTLEFDTANGYTPDFINVSGDIYAIAYRGTGNDGFVKTISITADGDIGNTVIDSLEFDTSDGYELDIINVSGNIYAIAYRGPGSDGYLKTISIDAGGDIGPSVIDALEFDTSNGFEPDIINVSGNTYAIAYRGPGNNGYLKTVSITPGGDIGGSVIDTLEFDTAYGYNPNIINVSGDIYAIVYRGSSNDGYLKTVSIAANGDIGASVIDTLIFDGGVGYEPKIVHVSGNIYAIAYRGVNSDGFVRTVSITPGGDIGASAIDSLEFDTSMGYEPDIVHIGAGYFAIAYRGPGSDGFVKTLSIAADGSISNSVIDTLEYDTASGFEPGLIHVSGDTFAVAYRGTDSDGFVKTISMTGSGVASADFEILATAGGTSVRASVNTANVTASVVSWRIE